MILNDNFGFVAPTNFILFAKSASGATWGYMGLHALMLFHFGEQTEAAISRFESSRPSQPVQSLDISPTMSLRRPPLAAFLR
jgi:hypothetical protein